MPFTLAHPALVLPLGKKRYNLSVTALIIGSMAPDFEFFFQMREVENIGHHWYGVLLFDLPVTLIACFLYHRFLRKSFMANLPLYFYQRFAYLRIFNWRKHFIAHPFSIVFSALLGIASHILLDGFTHYDGAFVNVFPSLSSEVTIFSKSIPVYFALQVILSLVGMAILFRKIQRMPILFINENRQGKHPIYWVLFANFFLLIMLIRLICWQEYNSFWGIFMANMGALIYSWILTTIFYKTSFLKTTNNENLHGQLRNC